MLLVTSEFTKSLPKLFFIDVFFSSVQCQSQLLFVFWKYQMNIQQVVCLRECIIPRGFADEGEVLQVHVGVTRDS